MSRLDQLYVYPGDDAYSPVESYRTQTFVIRNFATGNDPRDPPLPTAFFTGLETTFELVYLWTGLVDHEAVKKRWPNPEDQDGGSDVNAWYASCLQIMHAINKLEYMAVDYDAVVTAAAKAASQGQAAYIIELRRNHKPMAESVFLNKQGQLEREDFFYFLPEAYDAILLPGHLQDTFIPINLCQAVVCELLTMVLTRSPGLAITLSERIPKLVGFNGRDTFWYHFLNAYPKSAAIAMAILEFPAEGEEEAKETLLRFESFGSVLPRSTKGVLYSPRLRWLRDVITAYLPPPPSSGKRTIVDVLCNPWNKKVCIRSLQEEQ